MKNQQQIIVIEDNLGDLELIKLALDLKQVRKELVHLSDGARAMEYLNGLSISDPRRPHLIILDLNLPRVNGKELLHFVKNHPILKSIPVVVMSSSAMEQDIMDVYALNANCFISKPIDLDEFVKAVQAIDEFWFRTVALPVADC